MIHADALHLKSLSPFNIVCMFDVAFEPPLMRALAKAMGNSSVRLLVSFKRVQTMKLYGFNVSRILSQVMTAMCGSGETHTAYIYELEGHNDDSFRVSEVIQTALNELDIPDFQNLINERFREYQYSSSRGRISNPRTFYSPEPSSRQPLKKKRGLVSGFLHEEEKKLLDPKLRNFVPGENVTAVYNSWAGGRERYPAVVKKVWWDSASKVYRYQIVYDEKYDGKTVTEWGVETRFLHRRLL